MALIDKYVRTTASGGGDGSANNDGDAWTFAEAVSDYAAGQRINVIEGTYNVGATINLNKVATDTQPIVWRGRNSDDTGVGRPYFDMTTGEFQVTGDAQLVMDLDVTSTTNGSTIQFDSDGGLLYRCKVYNTSLDESSFAPHQAVLVTNASIVDCLCVSESAGLYQEAVNLYRSAMNGCKVVTGSSGITTRNAFRGNVVTNTIIIGSGRRNGIFIDQMEFYSAVSSYTNVTIYNFANGIALEYLPMPSQPAPLVIENCLFHTCVENDPSHIEGYAICSLDESIPMTTSTMHMFNNAYYGCDNGFHNIDIHDVGTIQCTDDPFANVSADDFSLNDLANGGALLRGAVIPLSFDWS